MVKPLLIWPLGIVTLAGTGAAVLSLLSVPTIPAVGAIPFKRAVALTTLPPFVAVGKSVMEAATGGSM